MCESILWGYSDDMGLIGDFLDLIGLGGITGVDILFAAMAIIGTFLFIIYLIENLKDIFTPGIQHIGYYFW